MMRLKIGIVRGAVAICLASTAIGGVVLALDGPSPPAGAMPAANVTEPSGIAITRRRCRRALSLGRQTPRPESR
jgi:hypothetical protein